MKMYLLTFYNPLMSGNIIPVDVKLQGTFMYVRLNLMVNTYVYIYYNLHMFNS